MKFDFSTAGRILFGSGARQEIAGLAQGFGRRALLVTGQGGADPEPVLRQLDQAGIQAFVYAIDGEPDLDLAQRGIDLARERSVEVVIGFGGGSVLDTAKAIAVMLTNPGGLLDYLEVVGKNQPVNAPATPCIAVPTTAGTGSEVTRNAVLAVPGQGVKVSLRGANVLPRVAVVDPELTLSLPPGVTAATGMDALTQVLEPYVSKRANALTDLYCRAGLACCARSLLTAYQDGNNLSAREDMSYASLMGGLSLANAGLGAVHGFAAPIGGMFHAPHGAICARLLPLVVAANIRAFRRRYPGHPVLGRYQEIAVVLTGQSQAGLDDGIDWLEALVRKLAIPPLSAYGIHPADVPAIVDRAVNASSMKGNPIELTRTELSEILERAI